VVLDMTGGAVTDASLAALAPFGRLAFYGMASRTLPSPVALGNLLARSTTVAGMWLVHALAVPGLLQTALTDLYGLVEQGRLRVIPGGEYPLSQARRAHEELRARRTVGKIILDPSL
jgi:NADPH:quinone reductase